MKIRFLEEWPRIDDKEGSFELRCVGGIVPPSIGEILAATRAGEEPRKGTVQIWACPVPSEGSLFCYDHFLSCTEAGNAMIAGIEVAGDSAAYGYATRCVKAGKAELLGKREDTASATPCPVRPSDEHH